MLFKVDPQHTDTPTRRRKDTRPVTRLSKQREMHREQWQDKDLCGCAFECAIACSSNERMYIENNVKLLEERKPYQGRPNTGDSKDYYSRTARALGLDQV
jgi:hypothetical protein